MLKCQVLQVFYHYYASSNRFLDINTSIIHSENVGQGHGVERSRQRHSMANIKISEIHI